jgi:hypothetical protein
MTLSCALMLWRCINKQLKIIFSFQKLKIIKQIYYFIKNITSFQTFDLLLVKFDLTVSL